MATTRQGIVVSEAAEEEHQRLCDALWDAFPEDYKDRADPRCGRVYFCDGVRAAVSALAALEVPRGAGGDADEAVKETD